MTSTRIRINNPIKQQIRFSLQRSRQNTSHKLCNATTIRLLKIDTKEILLTDTVGFINRLQTHLNSNTPFYTGTIRYIASPMSAAHTRRDDDD